MARVPLSSESRVFPASYRTYVGAGLLALLSGLAAFSYWEHYFHAQYSRAIPVAVVASFWSALLFVSAAHVWQRASRSLIGAGVFIVLLSAALSGFWMLVFYPATLSYDAIWQWKQALDGQYSAWHPPAMAMVMHLTQHWSQDPSLFSFTQGLIFWGCMFYLIRQVAGGARHFIAYCIVMALLPPLWLYANAMVSNTWTAAFMMLSAAWLIASLREASRRSFVLAVLALSVAVMFRREAAVLVVVMIAAYVWSAGRRSGVVRLVAASLLIVAAVWMPGVALAARPSVLKNDGSPLRLLQLNYYVGVVANARSSMTDTELERQRQSVDRAFGDGTFQGLLDRYACSTTSYIPRTDDDDSKVLEWRNQVDQNFGITKVVRLVARHPLGLLAHQVCYSGYLTQFSDLDYQDWGVIEKNQNMNRMRAKLGFPVDSELPSIRYAYRLLMKPMLSHPVLSLLARHYVCLVGAGLALVVGWRTRRAELIVPALFALVYPLAFVIAGPATPWRYLLPSYVLSWISILPLAGDLVARRPLGTPKEPEIRNRTETTNSHEEH